MFTNAAFPVTGTIMWFFRPSLAPAQREIFRWSAIVHQASFWLALSMFSLHLYLALLHPFTKSAITAMINGYVTRRYAALHHGRWLAQVESGKAAGARQN